MPDDCPRCDARASSFAECHLPDCPARLAATVPDDYNENGWRPTRDGCGYTHRSGAAVRRGPSLGLRWVGCPVDGNRTPLGFHTLSVAMAHALPPTVPDDGEWLPTPDGLGYTHPSGAFVRRNPRSIPSAWRSYPWEERQTHDFHSLTAAKAYALPEVPVSVVPNDPDPDLYTIAVGLRLDVRMLDDQIRTLVGLTTGGGHLFTVTDRENLEGAISLLRHVRSQLP